MRIDRIVSLINSAVVSRRRVNRVAVLMYHSISDRAEPRLHPYFKTVTSPKRFEEQMQWLADAGVEVVALNAWNSSFAQGVAARAVITFDDGFADFKTNAIPVLQSHGYPATMFLPTDFIDTGKELLPQVKHLGWSDIRRLSLAGVGFGSHTASHRHLETLSSQEIDEEVAASAEIIQNRLGATVTSFSCPFAFPQAHPAAVSALREALARRGFTVGVTTKIGTVSMGDDPYTLRRLPINSDDDKKLFMAKLLGGYDWLSGVQRVMRRAKKIVHR